MKIIRVFPQRTSYTPTDDLVFVGDPPLIRPEADEVHVSATFTWDAQEAIRLGHSWGRFYRKVKVGGPAFDDQGGEFEPGLYLRPGYTITSRGCSRRCPWCYVPRREGRLRLLKVKPGNRLNDNNLLACPRQHIEAVFEMLEDQHQIAFIGGLDARLLEGWHADWIEAHRRRISETWFAADRDAPSTWASLEKVAELLHFLNRRKRRCFVLIGWNGETIRQAEQRLEKVWSMGFMPFAQFYRGPGEQPRTKPWRVLQKNWSRPAAMNVRHA